MSGSTGTAWKFSISRATSVIVCAFKSTGKACRGATAAGARLKARNGRAAGGGTTSPAIGTGGGRGAGGGGGNTGATANGVSPWRLGRPVVPEIAKLTAMLLTAVQTLACSTAGAQKRSLVRISNALARHCHKVKPRG
jgi:hypothetical protein